MATQGTRWLVKRSTDLMPSLAKMAFAEFWNGASAVDPNPLEAFPGDQGELHPRLRAKPACPIG
jgi:hypothetical protein